MNLTTDIDALELLEHVSRVCRKNLQQPSQNCVACPFLKVVIDTMEAKGWRYNPSVLAEEG